MKKIAMLLAVMSGVTGSLCAQETETNPLTISGYAELYYQQDFRNPQKNTRPGFVYSHNRNNEFSVNLGLLKANFQKDNVRANLGVGVGSYMNANYAAEPGVLKNIYQANVGFKLSKNHNLWLDAGILPSHIGFESAIAADCFTLTRSMLADNSPYFETGAKLFYGSPDGKWDMALLILNGWQRIQRVDGNSTPAFGHQLTFRPSDRVTLNSSSFIGNDMPDENRLMRYFHNFYGQFTLSNQFALVAGFDIGAQQKEKGSSDYNSWYSPVLIAKYSPSKRVRIAARGEYYHDKSQVIVATDSENGFQTFGGSLNLDYQIMPNLVWRTEVKTLHSEDRIFIDRDGARNRENTLAITSLAIRF
ncbi:porin [Sphingobacterium griseoflavum]|uniref:Outer membrane protein n=1 Tax=Sphingobacterium griseoflavum TaxID=1474952 RepID=A0ABQ3HY36_9SPHI|nr:porin [Sphingobacterium griseoflavum]GHE35649.1 hypothetical protein GCM10017764_18680 [Sphingobacterium griseoflavum]